VGLKVTVLGCSGSYPGKGEACSGYLIRGAGTTLWLDAGNGTMANLQQHAGLDEVDAVVLSHEHPDHWSDLEGFRVACAYGDAPREGIPVYAPAGVKDKVSTDMEPPFVWNTVTNGDTVTVGGLTVRFSATKHGTVETLAARIDGDGQSLGYSADTTADWSLEALGRDLDLALCEATLLRNDEGKSEHLSARQAGEMARGAGARRLVLTHVWPTTDRNRSKEEGSEAYGKEVEMAATHATFEL
jgi:ribonuclease BN (tRNA processing enzyme)